MTVGIGEKLSRNIVLASRRARAAVAFGAVALLVAGCGSGGATPPGHAAPPTPTPTETPVLPTTRGAHGIDHIIVVIQENRTFDNLFHDYPGADSADSGATHDGRILPLTPAGLDSTFDLNHYFSTALADYDGGKMDGFDLEQCATPSGSCVTPQYPSGLQYTYVPRDDIKAYWALAQQYVLADRMFSSQLDASFSAHQYLVAGQSGGIDIPTALPWGCDAPAGTVIATILPDRSRGPRVFPCFSYLTIADRLDAKSIPWRYYTPTVNGGNGGSSWLTFDANSQIRYGQDWQSDIVAPEKKFLTDVHGGLLAAVTWVVPDFQNSDHPGIGAGSKTGPDWVASVVNAVGTSQFWSDSAIVVVWDDWGGLYDHVAPRQLDAHGLGLRVPLLVISPYAKQGYVSHVPYEFGSVLKFTESTFSLQSLAASDARANDLTDCFDFTQKPRPFTSVPVQEQISDFLRQQPSGKPPDDY